MGWMTQGFARGKDRGFALIGTYFLLALLAVYSGSVTMQTMTQHLAVDRLRDRYQTLDLARGTTEQLREDLYRFLSEQIYQGTYLGDAVRALQWLDTLDPGVTDLAPFFAPLPYGGATGQGTVALPRIVSLPSMGAGAQGQAWIASVCDDEPDADCVPSTALAPRLVTIEATATEGGVTKRIRTTFRIGLGLSDVFRYAYFVNNYGWFDGMFGSINGEVRANGNLRFTGSSLTVNGDLYAAANPDLIDPQNPLLGPARGDIVGDPPQRAGFQDYWNYKKTAFGNRGGNLVRPARRLVSPSQPAIGGTATLLPEGYGWDSDDPEQARYANRPIQPMPYLGDLRVYKQLAAGYVNPQTGLPGSELEIGGGTYRINIGQVYTGPDGRPDTADDTTPVVLIGTTDNPIELNGPVVIPGDVIIRGNITGQGTIYVGRNVHIVGSLTYTDPPSWPVLERRVSGRDYGRLRAVVDSTVVVDNLGTVDDAGNYTPP